MVSPARIGRLHTVQTRVLKDARQYSATRRVSSQTDPGTSLPKPRLNYRQITENSLYISHNIFNRQAKVPLGAVPSVKRLYDEHTTASSQLNGRRAEQAAASEAVRTSIVGDRGAAIEKARILKLQVHELEAHLDDIDRALLSSALSIPNNTHPSAPIGAEESAKLLSTHGPDPVPATSDRDHVSVGSQLDLLDLEAGSLVTGSSWYYLKNEAALLELALVNYACSIAVKHNFTPVLTPDVVKSDIAHRCGFQPRDNEESGTSQNYHLERSESEPQLILAGTAEIPLAGMFAKKVFDGRLLPLRTVGVGKAFRAEAGARGADAKGLYRVHQFTKVELFAVTRQDQSDAMMEELRGLQVEIFESLGFPFRVLDMPTEELGASAYRKYDMEAWMPGRGKWGEISSMSNCTDYQSRRLHIRYQPLPQGSPEEKSMEKKHNPLSFAHTLNGTAMAVPRILVALIENGVRLENRKVTGLDLPIVLKPFWIGGESEMIAWS